MRKPFLTLSNHHIARLCLSILFTTLLLGSGGHLHAKGVPASKNQSDEFAAKGYDLSEYPSLARHWINERVFTKACQKMKTGLCQQAAYRQSTPEQRKQMRWKYIQQTMKAEKRKSAWAELRTAFYLLLEPIWYGVRTIAIAIFGTILIMGLIYAGKWILLHAIQFDTRYIGPTVDSILSKLPGWGKYVPTVTNEEIKNAVVKASKKPTITSIYTRWFTSNTSDGSTILHPTATHQPMDWDQYRILIGFLIYLATMLYHEGSRAIKRLFSACLTLLKLSYIKDPLAAQQQYYIETLYDALPEEIKNHLASNFEETYSALLGFEYGSSNAATLTQKLRLLTPSRPSTMQLISEKALEEMTQPYVDKDEIKKVLRAISVKANTMNANKKRGRTKANGKADRLVIMLQGPPGTGKTRMARRILQELGLTYTTLTSHRNLINPMTRLNPEDGLRVVLGDDWERSINAETHMSPYTLSLLNSEEKYLHDPATHEICISPDIIVITANSDLHDDAAQDRISAYINTKQGITQAGKKHIAKIHLQETIQDCGMLSPEDFTQKDIDKLDAFIDRPAIRKEKSVRSVVAYVENLHHAKVYGQIDEPNTTNEVITNEAITLHPSEGGISLAPLLLLFLMVLLMLYGLMRLYSNKDND